MINSINVNNLDNEDVIDILTIAVFKNDFNIAKLIISIGSDKINQELKHIGSSMRLINEI